MALFQALSAMDDFAHDEVSALAGSQIWQEVNQVGAEVGGGKFKSTIELNPMNFKEAISTAE